MILTFEKICDSVAKAISIRYRNGDSLTEAEIKFWDNYRIHENPSYGVYRLDANRNEHLVPESEYLDCSEPKDEKKIQQSGESKPEKKQSDEPASYKDKLISTKVYDDIPQMEESDPEEDDLMAELDFTNLQIEMDEVLDELDKIERESLDSQIDNSPINIPTSTPTPTPSPVSSPTTVSYPVVSKPLSQRKTNVLRWRLKI